MGAKHSQTHPHNPRLPTLQHVLTEDVSSVVSQGNRWMRMQRHSSDVARIMRVTPTGSNPRSSMLANTVLKSSEVSSGAADDQPSSSRRSGGRAKLHRHRSNLADYRHNSTNKVIQPSKPFVEYHELRFQYELPRREDAHHRVDVVGVVQNGRMRFFVDKWIHLQAPEASLDRAAHGARMMSHVEARAFELLGEMHVHIVEFFGCFYRIDHDTMHLVVEFCEQGDLATLLDHDRLRQQQILDGDRVPYFSSENSVRQAFKQILQGVLFLQEVKIAHLNLSPRTIFVSEDGVFKIGSFDEATAVNVNGVYSSKQQERLGLHPSSSMRRCDEYTAPELTVHSSLEGCPVNLWLSDSWSCGMILFALLTQESLLTETTADDRDFILFQSVGLCEYMALKNLGQDMAFPWSNALWEVLIGLLQPDPERRWTVKRALQSTWVSSPSTAPSRMEMKATTVQKQVSGSLTASVQPAVDTAKESEQSAATLVAKATVTRAMIIAMGAN